MREYLVHIVRPDGGIAWQCIVEEVGEEAATAKAELVAKHYRTQWCGGEYTIRLERLDSWLRYCRYRGEWPQITTLADTAPVPA